MDENRLSVYHSSLQAIWQRPLLGSGAGTFPDMFPVFRSGDLWSWGVWDYAHSTILEIAFEMGIPVAATVAIGAAFSVVILIKAAINASDRTDRRTLSAIAGIATLVTCIRPSISPCKFRAFSSCSPFCLAAGSQWQSRNGTVIGGDGIRLDRPRRIGRRWWRYRCPTNSVIQISGRCRSRGNKSGLHQAIGRRRAAWPIATPSARFPART